MRAASNRSDAEGYLTLVTVAQSQGYDVTLSEADGGNGLYNRESAEDPDMGAHGDFFEEITDVAEDVVRFSARASATQICEYLC